MSNTTHDLPVVEFTTEADFEDWLEVHHAESDGAWVKIAKTGSGSDAISFDEALHVTLSYGWYGGVRRTVDSESFLQKFTPGSLDRVWSWIECDKSEWLIEQGRMQPAGMALVEAAKADDRWERAYSSRGELPVPDLLKARLASFPKAKELFESLDDRDRNALTYRLQGILDRETYMARVDQIVEMLKNGEKPY